MNRRAVLIAGACAIVAIAIAVTLVNDPEPAPETFFGEEYRAVMFPPASSDAKFAAFAPDTTPRHGQYHYPPDDRSTVAWIAGVNQALHLPDDAICLGFPEEAGGYDVVRCRYVVDGRKIEYFRSGGLAGLRVERRNVPTDDEEALAAMFDLIFARQEMLEPRVVGQADNGWYGDADPDPPGETSSRISRDTLVWWLDESALTFAAYQNDFDRNPTPKGVSKGELRPYFDPKSFEYLVPDGTMWADAVKRLSERPPQHPRLEHGIGPLTFQYRGIDEAFELVAGDPCLKVGRSKGGRDIIGCWSSRADVEVLCDGRRALLVAKGFAGSPRDVADALLEPNYPLSEVGRGHGRVFGKIGTASSPMWWWYEDGTLFLLGASTAPLQHDDDWSP